MRNMPRGAGVLAVLAVILPACDGSSPTEPSPPACTYTLSTTTLSFGASGGTSAVTVAAASRCAWTAVSDRGWMSITGGASGSGNGVVTVSVTPNSTPAVRTGTLTIAGQTVAVSEEGLEPCSVDISPASAALGKYSATGSFAVSAAAHCEWSAASTVPWLAVTSGSQGTGRGAVTYAVEQNREVVERSGTIVVGERTFTLTQAGDTWACEYSVNPVDVSPCMAGPGPLSVTVSTQQGCTWTAASDAAWIAMTGGESGSGPGVITFTVPENWAAPRQSVVMVRWPTPTAGQNVRVSQAGCFYAVTTGALSLGADGGPGSFGVFQQSEPIACGGPLQNACMWTAQADVPWITITTAMPQFGDNPVSFTVAPNPGTAARSGTIAVRDKIVTITQAGH